ncbi:MAG: glycerol-3-phosphate acyltransferase [Anaerolineae bacterium]|nr:glycerol-3-phosphate acyltransferase [Anaerolineae bacterium]
MNYLLIISFILAGYLFGSIPVGYVVARLYGINVTASGSGRTGGTNVLRAAGPVAAGLTVIGDVLKGMLPVYLLQAAGISPWVVALVGVAAVIGHNYSIFLGFRGGVGAGTAVGALGGISLPVGLLAAGCALVALWFSGYASILSTTIAVSGLLFLIIFAVLGLLPAGYILFGALTLVLIVYALLPNYARLRAGTERKISKKSNHAAEVP